MNATTEKTWIKDENGNQCSVEYWGSEEAARNALGTLKDCSGCSGCSGCSRCSRCSGLKIAKPVASETEIAVVPIIPNIHQRVYAAASMKDWHTCEKKHCRAGWVITLAGEAGSKLEQFFDPVVAAMKIYDASAPNLPKVSPVRFFEDDATALADMKRMAEMEAAQS